VSAGWPPRGGRGRQPRVFSNAGRGKLHGGWSGKFHGSRKETGRRPLVGTSTGRSRRRVSFYSARPSAGRVGFFAALAGRLDGWRLITGFAAPRVFFQAGTPTPSARRALPRGGLGELGDVVATRFHEARLVSERTFPFDGLEKLGVGRETRDSRTQATEAERERLPRRVRFRSRRSPGVWAGGGRFGGQGRSAGGLEGTEQPAQKHSRPPAAAEHDRGTVDAGIRSLIGAPAVRKASNAHPPPHPRVGGGENRIGGMVVSSRGLAPPKASAARAEEDVFSLALILLRMCLQANRQQRWTR